MFANNHIIDSILEIFNYSFVIGGKTFTPFSVFQVLFLFVCVFYFSKKVRDLLVNKILLKYHVSESLSYNIGKLVRYASTIVGSAIIIQSTGIDLSSLHVLIASLGVGIGFGLQTIADNFLSGIIILFEQPIKVGDMVEVGDVRGRIVEISSRSSTIRTNDNITVIVPNSHFISNNVINWSYNEKTVRLRIPIGVSYKEDPERIEKIAVEEALKVHGVLKHPQPELIFTEWGDSSINFTLNVWTVHYYSQPDLLKSKVYYALFKRFNAEQIEIPFPQRDLNLRDGWEKLESSKS
ncbi:mechanosensitive ion channel family protein [Flammeovirga sp. SJP92]|uniref:mechanosensitive ion channel family protein n=1 Tax=Flammeovirga sp. SJP92 TaxID=1775430 RepID=UPI000787DF36|nr:mechanosensitive ion channel domain-containing protein [Flammeovirga sp. SJP92]KXX67825.1 mechanosensitive ion channel protein MscS [Flammeovirga sp. SJP92]